MDSLSINYNQPEAQAEPEPLSPGLPTPSYDIDIYEPKRKSISASFPSLFHGITPTESEDHNQFPTHKKIHIFSPILEQDEEESEQYEETPYAFDEEESDQDKDKGTPKPQKDEVLQTSKSDESASHSEEKIDDTNDSKQSEDEVYKTMSVSQFKNIDIEELILNDASLRDNYEIGKKICKFFDKQFNDTDTVCMVAETKKQAQISYWCKGDFVRKHKNICNGKYILIYRACKHKQAKEPIVTHKEFVKFVKRISIENKDKTCSQICDILDDKFGKGCHYARSSTKKPEYDIYCRFSNKYECGFRLPTGAYIIAWRR